MNALVLHRTPAVAIGLLLIASGCGYQPSPATSAALPCAVDVEQPAPREIVLPQHVAELRPQLEETLNWEIDGSVAAGFQQLGGGHSGGARIRELSGTPAAFSPNLIREPAAVSKPLPVATNRDLAAPSPNRRSAFVPIDVPPEIAIAPQDHLPNLPPQPTFADESPRASRPQIAQPIPTAPALQPQPAPQQYFTERTAPAVDRAAMQPVSERAMEISNHAYGLAQRGMLYAARAELIQSLQLVAQALDVQRNTTSHAAALSAGLTALKEAPDFAPPPGRLGAVVNVAEIARAHQTPVLKDVENVSPVIAQQQYLAYAQTQLMAAAGKEPVASLTLFRLGKLQMAMAHEDSDPQMQHGPQAMTLYQAALAADDRNYLAANELGVLMARYGQLQEARRLLVHSVSIQPHVEAWHNLSVVHRRLGEADLAQRAEHERELLAQHSPASSAAGSNVTWVDPQTFAASAGGEVQSFDVARETASRTSVRGSASFGQTW